MDDQFRDFRQEFSNAYPGIKRRELRFLLHDHLPIGVLARENSGMTLFNELKLKGFITYNNVNIMSEIADVTENAAAKAIVMTYIKQVGAQYYDTMGGASLSSFRKRLYKALREITEGGRGDLSKMLAYYNVEHLNFDNKWDLIFYLEKEMYLDDRQDTLERFARALNKKAKNLLQSSYADDEREPTPVLFKVDHVAVPLQRKPLTPLNTDLEEDDFTDLLIDLSDWIKEQGNAHMFKLLLADFTEIAKIDIEQKEDPFDLFKLLRSTGYISRTDIDVIIAAFTLCGWYGAADVIKRKIPLFERFIKGIEITQFSQLRKNVIIFGRMLIGSKIKKICRWYNIDADKIADPWHLMFELDKRDTLTDAKFIERLEANDMKKEANALKNGLK